MPSPLADSFTRLFIGYDIYHVDESETLIGPRYKRVKRQTDETGENTIFVFAFPNTKLRFDATLSIAPDESDFTKGTVPKKIYLTNESIKWDFGDGSTAEGLIVEHVFDRPGVYYVEPTARDYNGQPRTSVYRQKIVVSDFVKTDVKWISTGKQERRLDLIPAGKVSDYFDIYATSSWRYFNEESNHTISVYASGSNSNYIDAETYLDNKYAHFDRTWRFTSSPESVTPLRDINTPTNAIIVAVTYTECIENGKPTGEYDAVYIYTSKSSMDINPESLSRESEYYNIFHATQIVEHMLLYDTQINDAYRPDTPKVSGYKLPDITSTDWNFAGHESITRVCYIDDTAKLYLSQLGEDSHDSLPVLLFANLNVTNIRTDTFNTIEMDILNDPRVEQWNIDVLPVGIVYNPPTTLSFTSTGIQTIPINTYKLKDALITFNIALVDDTKNSILKSPPIPNLCPSSELLFNPEIKLQKLTPGDGWVDVDYPINTTTIPIETPGCCNLHIDGITEPGQYQLSATAMIKDVMYMNKQVESYFVANMHSDKLFVFRPGYMDQIITFEVDHTISIDDFDTTVKTLEPPAEVVFTDSENDTSTNHFFCVGVDSNSAGWVADTDKDVLVKVDRFGKHIDTILVEGGGPDSDEVTSIISPLDPLYPYSYINLPSSDKTSSISSIAIDEHDNIWVALADGTAPVIKKIIESGTHNKQSITVNINIPGYDSSKLHPAKIETDRLNNVWVSLQYSTQHISSDYSPDTFIMMKYDQVGDPLLNTPIVFDHPVFIHDIIVDGHNDIWVTNSKITAGSNKGSLLHISESGTILKEIYTYQDPHTQQTVNFDKPSQLTLDMFDHLWVAHSGNTLVKFKTGSFENPPIYSVLDSRTVGPGWEDQQSMIDRQGHRQAIEGLSCDTDDRILVINNVDKKFYMFSSNQPTKNIYDTYAEPAIQLNSSSVYYVKDGYEVTQAFGDWTGVRWIQKYAKLSNTVRQIDSAAVTFHVIDHEDIQKVNEDIDIPEVIETMSFQDTLNSATLFHNNMIRQSIGGELDHASNLGKTVYEKTANFTLNVADIDRCNISHLDSLCSILKHPIKIYQSNAPATLRRQLDIFSIKYDKVIPSRDMTERQYNNIGYVSTFNIGRNLGERIDPETYIVRAGIPIVSLELFNNNYRCITPMTIQNPESPDDMDAALHQYKLIDYDRSWGWRLSYPEGELFTKYYDFFEFIPNSSRVIQTSPDTVETIQSKYNKTDYPQLEGIVDWSNDMTTVDENVTLQDWQHRDQSHIELMLESTIRRGLEIDVTE